MNKRIRKDPHYDKHRYFGTTLLCIFLVFGLLFIEMPFISHHAQAASPIKVTLSTRNFGLQFLHVQPDNLNNPQHAVFSLNSGSTLWYSLEEKSQPAGLNLVANDPQSDLVTSELAQHGLLPPFGIVPLNFDGTYFETVHLAASFSGPGQQIQLTLNPFSKSAAALDIFNLLLQLLGEVSSNVQVGLLVPGNLKLINTAIEKAHNLVDLINDLVTLFHAVAQHSTSVLGSANKFVNDLLNLFRDKNELEILGKILVLIVGPVIPSIAATLVSYASGLHTFLVTIKLVKFIADLALSLGSYFFQQDAFPTVILQSVSSVTPPPSLTPSSMPTLTLSPSPASQTALSANPGSISANNNCTWSSESVGWTCKVTLSNNQNAATSLNWSTSSSGIDTQGFFINFNPASGNLAPGQSAQVTVGITSNSHHSCAGQGFTGTLTFASSVNTVIVPWSCITPALQVSPGSLNGNTNCSSSDLYGPWTCIVTVSQQSQGEMTWSTSSSGINGITFNPDSGRFVGQGMPTQVTVTIPSTQCPASANLIFSGDANTVTVPWNCTIPPPTLLVRPPNLNPSACTAVQGGWQCQVQLINSASDTQPDNYFTSSSNLPGTTFSPSSGPMSSSQFLPVTIFIPSSDCSAGMLYFHGKWNTAIASWTCP